MRIRSIRPEFWRSDDITALPRELRLLFVGLWSYVDDNGVGLDDYRLVAADLFALEDDQKEVRDYVRDGLATLARALLVVRYTLDGKSYLFVPTWDKHQRVDRPGQARYPRPPEDWKPPTCEDSNDGGLFESDSRGTRDSLDAGEGEKGRRTTSANAAASPKPVDRFDEFWAAYPRRQKKQDAIKAWRQVTRTVAPERLIAAAKTQGDRWRAEGKETKYVPYPSSWLRGGSYDDELEPARLSLVPAASSFINPVAAFDDIRSRAAAREAARLIHAPWSDLAQPPNDPTPPSEWIRSQHLAWIDRHADEIRAALTQRQAG